MAGGLKLREAVGDALYTRRVVAGLSQRQLADRIGWAREIYARFERGKHAQTLTGLAEVAAAYGVTVLELIGPTVDAWENSAAPAPPGGGSDGAANDGGERPAPVRAGDTIPLATLVPVAPTSAARSPIPPGRGGGGGGAFFGGARC